MCEYLFLISCKLEYKYYKNVEGYHVETYKVEKNNFILLVMVRYVSDGARRLSVLTDGAI